MSIYKGENMISGGSVDTHFVRKPVWSQAVAITSAQIQAGYTAPADGLIVGTLIPAVANTRPRLTVNGVVVCMGHNNTSWASNICVQVEVNAGDTVIVSDSAVVNQNGDFNFVPYEDSTVSDVEVVTPELIRNMHDPDWSQAVSISANQLTAGYTAPKRGIIVGWYRSTADLGTPIVMKINNVVVSRGYQEAPNNYLAWDGNVQCSVATSDIVKLEGRTAAQIFLDVSFVPYKAQ